MVSRSIQGLVEKGYILSSRERNDRRVVRARTTAKGERLYQRMLPLMQARQARLLSALTPAERAATYRIIAKLHARLDEWSEDDLKVKK